MQMRPLQLPSWSPRDVEVCFHSLVELGKVCAADNEYHTKGCCERFCDTFSEEVAKEESLRAAES